MNTDFGYWLTAGALLTVVSVLASKLSTRLGVPALLIFLLVGMLAGSEGLGGIHFDDAAMAQALGMVALIYILFAGGLQTDWSETRPVAASAIGLSTLGVLLTCLAVAAFAWLVIGLEPTVALILGATVSSTDAAAVFSTFASQETALKGKLKPLLEFESGSNDPMAVFLTIGFVSLAVQPGFSPALLIPDFVLSMTVGAVAGVVFGRASVWLLNRVRLHVEGLYPVLTLALAPLVYSVADVLGGNGFLAVYLAGLVIGSRDVIHKFSLVQFHDGLAWLMQITMFVALGLLVFPSHLLEITVHGVLISLFLIVVGRPLSVFFTLLPTKFTAREKVFISWVGLRGAVPIILATFPLLAGVEQAETIFNLVFFIVLTSALLQGATIVPVARWLGLEAIPPRVRPVEPGALGKIVGKLGEVTVPPRSPAAGRAIVDLGIPRHVLILLVFRGEAFVLPRGTTVLEEGDRLLVLAKQSAMEDLMDLLCVEPEVVGPHHR